MRIEVRSSSANGIEYRAFPVLLEREGGGSHFVTISTGDLDRFNTMIKPDGWQLAAYMKNPVVLWAHLRSELPIGQAKRVWVDGDRLRAEVEWVSGELNPFADLVRRFYERGVMRAWSVGFRPLKVRYPKKEDEPTIFESAELVEFSAVTVSANPAALTETGRSPASSLGDQLNAADDCVLEIADDDVYEIEVEEEEEE